MQTRGSVVPQHFPGPCLAHKVQVFTVLDSQTFLQFLTSPSLKLGVGYRTGLFLRELLVPKLITSSFWLSSLTPTDGLFTEEVGRQDGLVIHLFSPSLYLYRKKFSPRVLQNFGFWSEVKILEHKAFFSSNNCLLQSFQNSVLRLKICIVL